MIASYLFEKYSYLINQATHHSIYSYGVLLVLTFKKIVQAIKYWLSEFQQKVDNTAGNKHLHFTAEIWTTDKEITPSTKKYNV